MGADGPSFYDNDAQFTRYMTSRQRAESPNDTLEAPDFLEMPGPVRDLRVLDLGCGDARFGRQLLEAGCRNYTGVEGSSNMVAAARSILPNTSIGQVIHARIEDWDPPRDAFDVVVSRLSFHYLADIDRCLSMVSDALVDAGRITFSVEHPVITSCDRGWPGGIPRQDWVVDNYHAVGPRVTSWLGGEVVKYHRTVEDYFRALRVAGFTVEDVREGKPRREMFVTENTYLRRMRIPLFLLMSGEKAKRTTLAP